MWKVQHTTWSLLNMTHVVNKGFEKSDRARFTIKIPGSGLIPTT